MCLFSIKVDARYANPVFFISELSIRASLSLSIPNDELLEQCKRFSRKE